MDRLRHWVDGRPSALAAIVCIDLDHFKLITDTLGHEAGDRVLATNT